MSDILEQDMQDEYPVFDDYIIERIKRVRDLDNAAHNTQLEFKIFCHVVNAHVAYMKAWMDHDSNNARQLKHHFRTHNLLVGIEQNLGKIEEIYGKYKSGDVNAHQPVWGDKFEKPIRPVWPYEAR